MKILTFAGRLQSLSDVYWVTEEAVARHDVANNTSNDGTRVQT